MAKRTFTQSKDGQDRTTARVSIRLTREQWDRVEAVAKLNQTTPLAYISDTLADYLPVRVRTDENDFRTLADSLERDAESEEG